MDTKEKCFINKTANYQLNQWDPGDRILREDFNADNERIDSAIAAARGASPYLTLLEVTTETAAQQVDVDVSEIDFTQYHKVELFVNCPGLSKGYTLRVNGLNSGYRSNQLSGAGSGTGKDASILAACTRYAYGVVLFYPPTAEGKVGCAYMYAAEDSYCGYQTLAPCTWSELVSFNVIGSSQLAAGTQIKICGVRK